MCGRYTLLEPDQIQQRFNTSNTLPKGVKPNFNVAPTQTMPIIVQDKVETKIRLMKWGVVPAWAASKPRFAFSTFNARAESLLEKPMWKKLFASKRCLVPSTGFYEWKKDDSKKQPYFIHVKDQPVFAMAGIYDEYTDSKTGEVMASFSIITTTPNKAMSAIHDRMPVILDKNEEAEWLNPKNEPGDLTLLLDSYNSKQMELYKVDPAVGKVSNQYIELTYPLNSQ